MITSPGHTADYTKYTSMINLKYANHHRYDFILERCPIDTDISWKWGEDDQYKLVWYKPEILKKYLPFYHYILFIDDDAIFFDQSKSIENIIEEYLTTSEQVIGLSDDYGNGNELNTGIILCKNDEKTFDILDTWISSTDEEGLCYKWRTEFQYEQACISDLYNLKYQNNSKNSKYNYEFSNRDMD